VVEGEDERPWFHDFGRIPFGEAREHTFRLTNTQGAPITLLDMQGGCSCSSVRRVVSRLADGSLVEGDPRATDGMLTVAPGAVAELTLRLDTSRTKANQDKLEVMRLRTDSDLDPFITFELHAFPTQLFQVTPSTLDLGDVPTSHGAAGEVQIVTGVRQSLARVVRILEQGERVTAEMTERESLGETVWTLRVTVPTHQPLGVLKDRIVLATTDDQGEGDVDRCEVAVWGKIVDDLVIYPRQISLGAPEAGSGARAEASLRTLMPGARVAVTQAELTGTSAPYLRVTSTPLAPDPRGRTQVWNFGIELLPEHPAGRIDAALRIHTDDENYPVVEAPLVGHVR
jgi:hypothetical protein